MQTLLQAQVELTDPASAESLGARQARETYAAVAAFGDDDSSGTAACLAISI